MFKFVLVAGLCVRAAFHEFQDRRAGDEPPLAEAEEGVARRGPDDALLILSHGPGSPSEGARPVVAVVLVL